METKTGSIGMNNDLERTLVDISDERQFNLQCLGAKDLSGMRTSFLATHGIRRKEPGAHTPGLKGLKNR